MSRFGCGFVIAGGGFRRSDNDGGVAAEVGDEGFAAGRRWRGGDGLPAFVAVGGGTGWEVGAGAGDGILDGVGDLIGDGAVGRAAGLPCVRGREISDRQCATKEY